MKTPESIIEEIDGDFRAGRLSHSNPIRIMMKMVRSDWSCGLLGPFRGKNDIDQLAGRLFDLSLSKKIHGFKSQRASGEIAMNGFEFAIVEYQIFLLDLKKGENESNITSELIERLCWILDSDSVKREWERLNEIRGH